MTRRSRRSRRKARRYAVAAVLAYAACWATAELGIPLAGVVVSASLVALVAADVPAPRTIRRWFRRTAVYVHRFSGLQGTGCRRGGRAYIGISNRPDLRAAQHRDSSWWHPLTDPALYTQRWHRTRIGARLAERWLIGVWRPVGNVQHNGAYARQSGRRVALRATADLVRGDRGIREGHVR